MSITRGSTPALAGLVTLGLFAPVAGAQGRYVEHEVTVSKGLAIGEVSGRHYLFACNVPNNTLEIYRTDAAGELVVLDEVPTGLSPVSVCYDQPNGQIYVANHIGDSVTRISFPTGGQPVATLEATQFVGDSPSDLAIHPTTGLLNVLLSRSSRLVSVDPNLLTPAGPVLPSLGLTGSTVTITDIDDVIANVTTGNPSIRVMKEPHRIVWENGRLHVLSVRGDNGVIPGVTNPALTGFSFDLFSLDTNPGFPVWKMLHGSFGSTNMGLAVAQNGNLLVAGSMARNDQVGSATLATLSDGLAVTNTGFVESHLYEVDGTTLFQATPAVGDRNLNLVAGGGAVVAQGTATANFTDGERVSMPSDVVLFESSGTNRAFVTSFHTDRIVVLDKPSGTTGTAPTIGAWTSAAVNLAPLTGYGIAGPRALAVKTALADPNDPGARLYCLNRLDNSISVLDPTAATVTELFRQPLQVDPTPTNIRAGRVFLYGAVESSGGHMVSCASCHVDGGTDGLAWRLGDPTSTAAPGAIQSFLIDGVGDQGTNFNANPTFPNDKELKVTQSLHGLVNHPVNPEDQIFFSNQPYHWRGDKLTFNDFNEAFVTLMGAPNVGTVTEPRGLEFDEMEAYRIFIDELMYPPNPEQPYEREYAGDIGTPNGETDGTGAKRGMKLFHIHPLTHIGNQVFGGRSCVGCHQLPDGSSNTITLQDVTGDEIGFALFQPLESSAMRSLGVREGRLATTTGSSVPFSTTFRWSNAGLTQGGLGFLTINDFLSLFFSAGFGPLPLAGNDATNFDAVIEFARSFDSGVAPSVGPGVTVFPTPGSAQAADPFVAAAERQAEQANCGLVAFQRLNGTAVGYYYDVTQQIYVDPATNNTRTRSNLMKSLGAGDVSIFQGVHVGSERRIALTQVRGSVPAAPASTAAPGAPVLLPMTPPVHWREVPLFTKNWSPPAAGTSAGPNDFVWGMTTPEPISLRAMREYQNALLGAPSSFGLPGPRHEAPRRFRVSGADIRHGARLLLGMPAPTGPLTPPPYTDPNDVFVFELDLHPRLDDATGQLVWETTVEAEPMLTYILMNGGTVAPGVFATFLGDFTQVGSLDPTNWNSYVVAVQNEDGTISPITWQPVTVQ